MFWVPRVGPWPAIWLGVTQTVCPSRQRNPTASTVPGNSAIGSWTGMGPGSATAPWVSRSASVIIPTETMRGSLWGAAHTWFSCQSFRSYVPTPPCAAPAKPSRVGVRPPPGAPPPPPVDAGCPAREGCPPATSPGGGPIAVWGPTAWGVGRGPGHTPGCCTKGTKIGASTGAGGTVTAPPGGGGQLTGKVPGGWRLVPAQYRQLPPPRGGGKGTTHWVQR